MRLKWALFAGFLVVAVCGMGLAIFAEGLSKAEALRTQRDQSLQSSAFLTALRVRSYLAHHLEVAEFASRALRDISFEAPERQQHLLDDLRASHPGILTMLVANAEGQIVISSPKLPATAEPASVSDRDYFQQAFRRAEGHISNSFRGRSFGTDPIVAVAQPVRDREGNVVGVIQAALDLTRFAQLQDSRKIVAGSELLLIDGNGMVVYASEKDRFPKLADFRVLQSGLDGVFSGNSRSVFADGTLKAGDGSPDIAVSTAGHTLETSGMKSPWTVIVYQDTTILQSLVRSSALRMAGVFAAAVAAAAAAAGFVARQISRPIDQLARDAHRASREDTTLSPSGSEIMEIQELSSNLAMLNGNQRAAMAELKQTLREKEALAAKLVESGAELERNNQELEQRVQERTEELRHLVEQLRLEVRTREQAQWVLNLEKSVMSEISRRAAASQAVQVAIDCISPHLPGAAVLLEYQCGGITLSQGSNNDVALALAPQSRLLGPKKGWVEARSDGFKGCWRQPLLDIAGRTIGYLDVYLPASAESLSSFQIELIANASTLISYAIRQQEDQERAIDLQGQLAEAQRFRAMGTFASGVAHTFNNLLVPILLGSQRIQLIRGNEREAQEMARSIEDAAKRAAVLVRQILVLANDRLATADQFDLRGPLGRAVAAAPSFDSLPPVISINAKDEQVFVRGDPEQLQQAFMNLLTNSIEAGATLITVTIEEADKAPPALPAARYVRIHVYDNGRGIQAEVLPRIFEPFFSTKPAYAGRGLGLPFARASITAHGGHIEVKSGKSSGTHVIIHLPIDASERPAAVLKDSHAQKLSVLLVDDDPIVAETTRAVLSGRGHQVAYAKNGDEALAILRAQPTDLMITDYSMPGMDGLELARRALAAKPELGIVIYSGYGQEIGHEYSLPSPKIVRLSKPFTLEQLDAAIQDAR